MNGIVNSGNVKAGDPVLIGPDSIGGWQSTVIKSIQRKRYIRILVYCSVLAIDV